MTDWRENTQEPASGDHVLAKVLLFSIALALVFTLVANTLPQVEGEAPEETELELGAMNMDAFITLGESLFSGKGTCTLCHNALGRAPDILAIDMGGTARERLADERYQGKAGDVEAYLRESMVDPGAYVVRGFGKKGTNDTVSPMPAVDKPPIQLSDIELDAVIAYMQAKDGNAVTVSLPTESAAPEPVPGEPAAAPATTAQEAIGKYGCAACHTMLGTESPVGPELGSVGARLGLEEIRQSIIDPNAVVPDGTVPNVMPADFADRMTARELEMIVQFLAKQQG